MKKLPIKYLVILGILILTCSVLSHKLSGKETLQDYAEKNPEVAYATREPGTPSPSGLSDTSASVSGGVSLDTGASAQNNTSPDINVPSASASDPSSQNAVPFPLAEKVTDSIEYETGFFYQPLTYPVIHHITGFSYPMSKTDAALLSSETPPNILSDEEMASLAISYEDLRYMNILYYDFNGDVQTGELICNKAIAEDLIEIFYELYENEYQIESVRLIDDYNGDDTASMEANNTSCFNYRPLTTGWLTARTAFPSMPLAVPLTSIPSTIPMLSLTKEKPERLTFLRPAVKSTLTVPSPLPIRLMKMISATSSLRNTASPGVVTGIPAKIISTSRRCRSKRYLFE